MPDSEKSTTQHMKDKMSTDHAHDDHKGHEGGVVDSVKKTLGMDKDNKDATHQS